MDDTPTIKTPRTNKNEMTEELILQIPRCCKEGWPDCPHVAREEKVKSNNIGL